MANSYASIHIHTVWSTKERRPFISSDLKPRLHAYLGGIAKENGFPALEVGGVSDHVHALIQISARLSAAHAVQLLKGGSSKWIHETFPKHRSFAWQEGYGAFSVSPSQLERVRTYIQGQEKHHATVSFQDEYRMLLKKYGIAFDEKYVWG